ncbi:hypothetical protein BJX61DRAFT_538451 [Aspergillus egyptiacus]|nr:hypothetical protein BJX61DRAFT_538451 [Aspergillus egyptiacus]
MPFNILRRGGSILQKLPVKGAFSQSTRVITSQRRIRHISFVTRRPLPTLLGHNGTHSSILVGGLARSYATKASPKKPTKSKKSKTTKKKPAPTKGRKRASKAAKKPLTTEEAELKAERKKLKKRRELIRELKQAILQPPKPLVTSYYAMAVGDKYREASKNSKDRKEIFQKVAGIVRGLSDEEKQHYIEVCNSNKSANDAAYKAWIESFTPQQIREANLARRRLSELQGRNIKTLKDYRAVKRPIQAWVFYVRDRSRQDGLENEFGQERVKRYAVDWRKMSDAEKQKYLAQAKADTERYEREHLEVYGRLPTTKAREQAKQQA